MRATRVAGLAGLLVVLLPLAAADYTPAYTAATCSGTVGYSGLDFSQSLPAAGVARNVPVVKAWVSTGSADTKYAPVILGIATGPATSASSTLADNYWTTGAIHASLVKFVAFRLRSTTGAAANYADGVDVVASFENRTVTLMNNSHNYAVTDVSWHQPAAQIPAGALYHYRVDSWNFTTYTTSYPVFERKTSCTDNGSTFALGSVGTTAVRPVRSWMAFTTPGVSAPSPPQAIAATAHPSLCALSWGPPATDGGSNVTGYRIYRNATALASIGTNVTYLDARTQAGVLYTYGVSALNIAGESAPSVNATCRPGNLGTVAVRVMTYGPTARLAWNWSQGVFDLESWEVYRDGVLVATRPANVRVWSDPENMPSGGTVCYHLTAVTAVLIRESAPVCAEGPRLPARPPLTGPHGVLVGGSVGRDGSPVGGLGTLAESMRVSEGFASFFLGVLLIVVALLAVRRVSHSNAILLTASFGVTVVNGFLGFWPWWLLFSGSIVAMASYGIYRTGRARSASE